MKNSQKETIKCLNGHFTHLPGNVNFLSCKNPPVGGFRTIRKIIEACLQEQTFQGKTYKEYKDVSFDGNFIHL
ncbi:hypothetical protein PPM_p0228 (plasmid) [Paenibacillus polymyxa M1]|nr:hypothetical protein PPM_p0228 [Paenibacillus polymyxa M1]